MVRSLGFQGFSGLMQGRQGPQDRTLEGTSFGQTSWLPFLWGCMCGKWTPVSVSSYNETAPFLALEERLLLCVVKMGAVAL